MANKDNNNDNDRTKSVGADKEADPWAVTGTGTAADKVRAALADPELKRALEDLRALTPAGEPMFGFPLRARDARDEVPVAEEVPLEEGAALVAQKEAAAAYVEDAAPSTGRAPRMPTSKIRLSAEVVASDTRRQVTQPSIRRLEVASVVDGAPVIESAAVIESPAVLESAAAIEAAPMIGSAAVIESSSMIGPPRVVERAANAGTEASSLRAAPSVSPRSKPARRADRSHRKVAPVVLVSGLVFVAVIGVGLAITRSGGDHAADNASIRATAESMQVPGAGSCSVAGREPCPTVNVTSGAPSVSAMSTKSAAPSSNASGTAASMGAKTSAGPAAKPSTSAPEDLYPDAASGGNSQPVAPSTSPAPADTVTPSSPTGPASPNPKPLIFE